MSIIINRLVFLLKQKGFSQTEVAKRIGKHSSFVSRKLNSKSMETKILEDILEVTDISLKELFCEPIEGLDQVVDFPYKIQELQKQLNALQEQMTTYSNGKRPHGESGEDADGSKGAESE